MSVLRLLITELMIWRINDKDVNNMQIENMYLSHNRPGTIRSKTTAIAVHWVGNPGTSAKANRNYFQNTDRSVSSNYIVGLDGEIICCIPDNFQKESFFYQEISLGTDPAPQNDLRYTSETQCRIS